MTFADRIKEMLVGHGLYEEDALAVIKMMKADEGNKPMSERWGNNVEGCPQTVLTVLWLKAKKVALKYIDANCPQVWFRSMFEEAYEES